ncbi:MAG: hypothetical protein RIB44_01475 [Lacipirellulaceae bacterium]
MKSSKAKCRQRNKGFLLFACLIVLLAGCGGGVSKAKRMLKAFEAAADLLESVKDEPSALKAKDELGGVFQEMIDSLKEVLEHEKKYGQTRGEKFTINKLERDLAKVQGRFAIQGARLDILRGLPSEFWDEMRLHSCKMLLALAETQVEAGLAGGDASILTFSRDLADMYENIGPSKIVELTLQNTSPAKIEEVKQKLKATNGGEGRIVDAPDPENYGGHLMAYGPVESYDEFVASLTFGTITEKVPEKGEITLDLGQEITIAGQGEDLTSPEVQARMQAEREAEEKKLAEEQAERLRKQDEARQKREQERAMAQAKREEERLAREAAIAHQNRRAEPSAPDYHETLVGLFEDEEARHRDEAIKTLLTFDTEAIKDIELKKRIAKGFKKMAFEDRRRKADGVKGMVHWGGRHSVPLLIKLLEQDSNRPEEAIFVGLGEHPHAKGADAVVKFLGNRTSHDQAVKSLRNMGPVAEDALIKAAPNQDAKVSLAAVELLGKVGTEKCFKALRLARKSGTREVSEAAVRSFAIIREREKQTARN